MNSTFGDIVQGFLNKRSVLHSVECRLKSRVTPASSSSHFSIGVTSTATVGPNPDPPPLTFQLAAPPSSRTATDSFSPLSTDCAKVFRQMRNKNAINTDFVALTRWPLDFAMHTRITRSPRRGAAGREPLREGFPHWYETRCRRRLFCCAAP